MAFDFKNGLGDLMKQAQKVQEDMQRIQEELTKLQITGTAGGDAVRVIMNGRHQALKFEILDEELMEEKEILEELIVAAINKAVEKIEETSKGKMADFTRGLNLPEDFKLPTGNE